MVLSCFRKQLFWDDVDGAGDCRPYSNYLFVENLIKEKEKNVETCGDLKSYNVSDCVEQLSINNEHTD